MRWFLRKLRQLLVNTIILVTTVCAVTTILIPNTTLYSRILWIGSAIFFGFIFLILPRRKISKNRSKDSQAYIVLKDTGEYEHRSIAKQILNRNLFPNEVVHHINGKRSDNRLINLCVMDRYQHELFHAWLDWKVKKSGNYPSFKEQKRLLTTKHNGLLLENQSGIRHTFVIEKSENYSHSLFSALRQERNRLAREKNIPAYLVFKNFSLVEMAQQMPQDAKTMTRITGVTPEKFRLYGDHFLAVIWKYKSDIEKLKKGNSVS